MRDFEPRLAQAAFVGTMALLLGSIATVFRVSRRHGPRSEASSSVGEQAVPEPEVDEDALDRMWAETGRTEDEKPARRWSPLSTLRRRA